MPTVIRLMCWLVPFLLLTTGSSRTMSKGSTSQSTSGMLTAALIKMAAPF
ncbi:hypothetical protein cypCar_00045883 [Cyprinus carpio]|nr:hypothetical protein cypCar_00045883 [Cyprinus carpio]